ncbi:MAG: MucR family transcriptional regulator [Pseudomonadota bacterium]
MTEELSQTELLDMTAKVIAHYVSNNPISAPDLPGLMTSVHEQLTALADEDAETPRPDPAVPIKKSVTRNYIICLEDGAKLKMLKRYIRTRYNLSPEEYRARWGLPADYPMVAPEYAERRSRFAKEIGLGKKPA